MSTDLSIVIVNWNTRELLAHCLESIYATVQDHSFEVLVVDNGSTDGSVDLVREQYPQARLIVNRDNYGFARANNQAARGSTGRYILLLNSDTVVLPQSLDTMVEFMEANSQVGAVGPRLVGADGHTQFSSGPIPGLKEMFLDLTGLSRWRLTERPRETRADSPARRVGWIQGACLLMRREAIGDVGLLDEDYFMYTEELDWCYRAGVVGWSLYYLPFTEIIHLGGQSAAREPATRRSQLYGSKLLFIRKHYGWPAYASLKVITKGTALFKLGLAAAALAAKTGKARLTEQDALRSYYLVLRRV